MKLVATTMATFVSTDKFVILLNYRCKLGAALRR